MAVKRYDWECVMCVLYPCVIQMANHGWLRTKRIRTEEDGHAVEMGKWAVMATTAVVFVVYWAGTLDQRSDVAIYALMMYIGSVVAASDATFNYDLSTKEKTS